MAKIQNIGVGKFIRSPRGIKGIDSKGMNIESMQIVSNEGNSFRCCPVTNGSSNPIKIDTTRFIFIPIDTDVDQVTINTL